MAQGVANTPALQQVYAEQGGPSEPKSSPRRETYRHTYGAIDLGTNNCRLLIARPTDGTFTVIDAFSRIVRLGEGLSLSGALAQDAMDRALGALSVCADKLRRRNVSLSRSVAT
jgi:exopolyphosphatase / guanosine-5'-triphosphate,3'-diphosphate pyrophosphatase